MLRRAVRSFLFVCVSLALVGSAARAQVTGSAINGKITNAKGEAVPGAVVQAVHVPTSAKYSAVTSADGRFNLLNLKSGGPYRVKVTVLGYRTETQDSVFLALGNSYRLDFPLSEQAVAIAEIVVNGTRNTAIAPEKRTGPSINIDRQLIRALPTLSRSLQDFTRLTPQSSANSFGGSNFRYNNITIDGAVNNDAFGFSASSGGVSGVGPSGTPGSQARTQPISLDAIQEVQVVLAPFDVQLGNFTGGSVNAVTRSGTNQVTGSIYSYGRNQMLTGLSIDGLKAKIADYHDYQAGARFGGAIVPDKLFYFFNADIARRFEPVLSAPGAPSTFVSLADAKAVSDTLKARYGYDAGSYQDYSINTNSTKVFGRLDWNISEQHKLTLRNNFVDADAGNLQRGTFLTKFGSQDYIFHDRTNSAVAELKSSLGNGVGNSLIVGYSDVRDHRDFAGTVFPQVEITYNTAGQLLFGTDREAAIYRMNQKTFELTDNLNFRRGAHNFTVGTHNELYGIQYFFLNAWNGRWQYGSLANFFASKPSRVRGTYSYTDNSYAAVSSTPSADFKVLMPSAYVQDEIAIGERFRITPGLRVDVPTLPDKIPVNPQVVATPAFAKYNNNILGKPVISPRLGFNWDVNGDRSLVVRGGTGVFTGRMPFAWMAYGYYNTGLKYGNVDLRPTGVVPLVANPANLSQIQSGLQEINLIDPNFKMPQVERSSLGFDFKVPGGAVATLEGMYSKALQDVKFMNIGLKDSTASYPGADGRPIYQGSPVQLRVNPNFTSVFLLTNTTEGYRYSLTAQLKRDVGPLDAMVGYTYGMAKDVSNGIRNSPQSNWEFNQSTLPNSPKLSFSNFDIRNRVVANIAYNLALPAHAKTTISLVYSGQSGSPYSYVYANDFNRDGSSSNDLIYVPATQSDIRLVPSNASDTRTSDQIWQQLNTFIEGDGYLRTRRGQYAERNGARTPWNHQLDLRIMPEFEVNIGGRKQTMQITLDVINFTNMLNSKWGRQYFLPNEANYNFSLMKFVAQDAATKIPTFSYDAVTTPWQVDQLNSRWQAQLGVRYLF